MGYRKRKERKRKMLDGEERCRGREREMGK